MKTEPELPINALSNPRSPQKRILVVEDNSVNQKVIVQQLESLGYAVDVVAKGQAAIEATAQTAYLIVLMDCCLPDMDGYTATRLIRQQEQQMGKTARTIIIALTANDGSQTEAIAAGMDDFLTKPLRRETLAQTLERWIHLAQSESVSAAQWIQSCYSDTTAETDAPAASMLLEQHFDLDHLHQLSDHNPEFEQELLQLYLHDTEDQLQQLQQSISRENTQQIERIAHHIKGASASVGAKQLEREAENIERQARQQQLEHIGVLVAQLEQTFRQVQGLLSAWEE